MMKKKINDWQLRKDNQIYQDYFGPIRARSGPLAIQAGLPDDTSLTEHLDDFLR